MVCFLAGICTPCHGVYTPSLSEIARLQNSISHLKRTQEELKEYADDPDVSQAIKENDETMLV